MLPNVPPVGDSVPGYESSQWYGLSAPAKMPADIVATLNKEINAALADPRMKSRFADIGGEPLGGSPDAYGKLVAEETEKWDKVVKSTGMKPE
jgi:tripartite-type tricarboxylate transporter receptor subunit TctC